MTVTVNKRIYTLNKRFGTPKFQKGILHPVGFWKEAASGGWTNLGANRVVSGLDFDKDGFIEEIGPGALTRTAILSGEWWTEEPETDVGAGYEMRCASMNGGSTWSVQAAAVGTWITLDAGRVWHCQVTAMASPATKSAQGNFEFGVDGAESADETGIFSGYAEN